MPTRSGLLRLATAGVLGASSLVATAAFAAPADAATTAANAYLVILNQERAAHGLAPLTMRTDLNSVAQGWADHMAASGVLMHNPSLASEVTNWQSVGENVGEGPSVTTLATAFWNSPEHRSNILDSTYNDVGIGTATGNGALWITVDFRDPARSESVSAAPVTTSTVAHTVSSTTAPTVTRHRTLRYGMHGSDVAAIQRRLHVTADGAFGAQTRRAVNRFKAAHGLRADGIVGRHMWRLLGW